MPNDGHQTRPERFAYLLPSDAGPDPASGKHAMRWAHGAKPFDSSAELRANPAQGTVRVVPGAFTHDECEQIVAIGESGARVAGRVDDAYEGMRISELSWIHPQPATHWLYHRIGLMFLEANRVYRFNLVGLQEPLQFSRYSVGGHFDWHIDMGGATSGRKLSLTIQLSDPSEYTGGELQFMNQHGGGATGRGTAVFFPSFLAHRVTPVTHGMRRALVAWAYGPSFE
jgi:PKHD-type hydroxylase